MYVCRLPRSSVLSFHSDMDDETTSLVGEYGHCAQELVNLMITGRCITNVLFDRWVIRTDSR